MRRFLFRLAGHLKKTVQELLHGIPGLGPGEELEWLAFHQLEPFGDDHYWSANLTAQLLNIQLVKGATPITADDFFSKPITAEQQAKKLEQGFRQAGIKIIDNTKRT